MITLIVVFEVPAESVEHFISDWKMDKDLMIDQFGFIDGVLYRSSQSDVRFRFVNVARWKSEDDWQAAIKAGDKYRVGKGINRRSAWNRLDIKVFPAIYHEDLCY